ncbi:uncharacterized protein LOC110368170 isoform X3 [Fundulus heteroclitus]|uniref:uncharacterized protein LOC110368170 isoform X3 n=1 Tax=Fundulus heteroclitus TaxID=8078 RepID=UPI00165CBEF6|nr:uncharacterized protein LOC110368170 isoform X3 [Fundulus heteroclitus]
MSKFLTETSEFREKVFWEKMICRILLLIILNSCLCATFVVNVTQSSYQAEENHSITLEWTFTTTPDEPWRDLFIYCSLLTPRKELVLYQVHDGVEVSESQDEQFSGRVQIDKDVLREGRIRLHVSRLRTEDSGLYLCDVQTDEGSGSGSCQLNVSAAADQLQPHTENPQPDHRGRIGLYFFLLLLPLSVSLFILGFCFYKVKYKINLIRSKQKLSFCPCSP